MLTARGRMFICVDKCYPYLSEVVEILQKTITSEQVFINSEKNLQDNRKDYGDLISKINLKPIVKLDNKNSNIQTMEYASELKPLVMELVFKTDTSRFVRNSSLLTTQKIKIWHNALWGDLCAGHDDDIAVEENRPADSWDWLIAHGATIIQTDRPNQLLQYLKIKKLHR
jgi:glycerophosphoryl diester phosphodiesterase